MNKPSTASAFTLLEVLVVIFIFAVFAAMLRPAFSPPGKPSYNVLCLSNQKQLALGCIMYENDNHGQFPWQVRNPNGVVTEFVRDGHAASQFKATADYLKNFKIFICASDKKKTVATNSLMFTDSNLSYFVGFEAGTNQTVSILTGDRHLMSNGQSAPPGLFTHANGSAMNWSRELHGNIKLPYGNLSFADGHAQGVRGANLTSIFERQGLSTDLLAVP